MHHLPEGVEAVDHGVVEDEDGVKGGKWHNGHVSVGSTEHCVDIVVERLEGVILGCIWCPPFIAEDRIVVVVGKEIEESLLILDEVAHEILFDGGVVGGSIWVFTQRSPSRAGPAGPRRDIKKDARIRRLEVIREKRVGNGLRPCWSCDVDLWGSADAQGKTGAAIGRKSSPVKIRDSAVDRGCLESTSQIARE